MSDNQKLSFKKPRAVLCLLLIGVCTLAGCATVSQKPIVASTSGPAVIYDTPPGYKVLRPKYQEPSPYYYYPRTRIVPGYKAM